MIFAVGLILLLSSYWMRRLSLRHLWIEHWSDYWPLFAFVGSSLVTASIAIVAWRALP